MLEVWLCWQYEVLYEVFTAKVKWLESGFVRKHGGRLLWVDGYGAAMSGKGRTPMQMSWGKGAPPGQPMGEMISLKTVLEEAAKHAGYAMHIAPELADIKRDWWAMTTESFSSLWRAPGARTRWRVQGLRRHCLDDRCIELHECGRRCDGGGGS